jgi:lysophospholipase L1-like esterase
MTMVLRIASAALLIASLNLSAQRSNRSPTHIEYSFLKQDFTILFQGDSITDGGRAKVGNDLNHTMGQDYAYLLAAQLGAELPERNLHFLNRGISGERVPDLAARWQQDTLALKPDILSILIGINDQLGSHGPIRAEEYEADYDKLLALTIAALPTTRIVLGEPFLLPVGKHKANYDAELAELKKRQAAVSRLGAKYRLPVVHYQQAFDDVLTKAPAEYWLWDGVHPTYAGHGLMARVWLRTVSEAWGTN